jgi:hypothetical protein
MRPVFSMLALGLVFGFATAADAGPKGGQKGAKKHHGVHGVVVAVTKDKDKDSGALTVKVHHGKKGASENAAEDKTFKVTPETKFQKVSGTKGARQETPATFADVHQGEHVVIHHKGDVATEVKIVAHKKKN